MASAMVEGADSRCGFGDVLTLASASARRAIPLRSTSAPSTAFHAAPLPRAFRTEEEQETPQSPSIKTN